MVDTSQVDWKAIDSRPEFQDLHRKKMGFLWGLMIFSLVYYFLLPIGAAYFQDIYKIKVWGPVNVGILFALSEFVVAWATRLLVREAREHRVRSDGGGNRPRRREAHGRPQMSSRRFALAAGAIALAAIATPALAQGAVDR